MAKKKKTSSKVTKEQLENQNEAIGEQLAGLQMEVEYLDGENDILAEENDELEEKNDVLQDVIVSAKKSYESLQVENDRKEATLKLADLVIAVAGEFEKQASARIADLEQENFHLSIQRDAKTDLARKLSDQLSEKSYELGKLRLGLAASQFPELKVYQWNTADTNRTATGRSY